MWRYGFVILLTHIIFCSLFVSGNPVVYEVTSFEDTPESFNSCDLISGCNLRSAWSDCMNGTLFINECIITIPDNAELIFNSTLGPLEQHANSSVAIHGGLNSSIISTGGDSMLVEYNGHAYNNSFSSLVIHNLNIQDFSSSYLGGVISFIGDGNLHLNSIHFNNTNGDWGGSIYVNEVTSGDVLIENCEFVHNSASDGGAIMIDYFTPNIYIQNCTFEYCHAANFGGAIYLGSGNDNFTISNIIFNFCTIDDGLGSAIYVGENNHDMKILDNIFEKCTSNGEGTVYLSNNNNNFTMFSTTFILCKTYTGGALYISDNNQGINIYDTTFQDCNANFYGGAIYFGTGNNNVSVVGSTFSNCESNLDGGCIYAYRKNNYMHIENCSFENSTSISGGALYLNTENEYFIMESTSFIYCTADDGGAIMLDYDNNDASFYNIYISQCNTSLTGCILSISQINLKIYSTIIKDIIGSGLLLQDSHEFVLIVDTIFTDIINNNLYNTGGAIVSNDKVTGLTIAGCTFERNVEFQSGGAVKLNGGNSQFLITDSATGIRLQTVESKHPFFAEGKSEIHNITDSEAIGFILRFDSQSELTKYDYIIIKDQNKEVILTISKSSGWPGYSLPSLRIAGSYFTIQTQSSGLGRLVYGFKLYIIPILSQIGNLTVFDGNQAGLYGNAIYMDSNILFPIIMNTKIINSYGNGRALSISASATGTILENIIFQNNYGGALSVDFSNAGLIVNNCQFIQNIGIKNGGAVYIGSSNGRSNYRLKNEYEIQFINCSFVENNAIYGGAIYIDIDNSVILDNILIQNNNATISGGGIYLQESNDIIIKNSSLSGNIAIKDGGALYIADSNTLSVENSQFDQNSAEHYGGAWCMMDTVTTTMYDGVVFESNTAGEVGGAVAMFGLAFWRQQQGTTALIANTAKRGSALYFRNILSETNTASYNLDSLYIADNTARVGGTVYWLYEGNQTSVSIGNNAVFANNTVGYYGPELATQALSMTGPTVHTVDTYGTALSPTPVFTLSDYYNQEMPIQGPSEIRAVLTNYSKVQCDGRSPAIGGLQSTVMNANATFNSLDVDCAPSGSTSVLFEADLHDLVEIDETVQEQYYKLSMAMRLDYRACYRGEFIKDGRCEVCPTGSYSFEYPVTTTTSCVDCTKKGGVTTCQSDVLEVSAGYWRRHDTSIAVLDCLEDINGCQGGNSTGEALCEEGYEGPLCAVCSDGYYSSSGSCELCGEEGVILRPAVITFLCIASVVATILAFFFYAKCVDDSYLQNNSNALQNDPPTGIAGVYHIVHQGIRRVVKEMRAQIKILVTTYQIVSTIPSNMSVDFPETFSDFLNVFSVFNLNVVSVVPFSCQQRFTFIDKLIFTTLFPIVLSLLLVVLFLTDSAWQLRHHSWTNRDAVTKKELEGLKDQYLTYFFFLTYLVLPSVSTTIFQTFLCTNVDPRHEDSDPSDSYLIADMSISCTSEYYERGVAYAVVMLFVYVVGIPTMYFVLLYGHRDELLHRDDATKFQDAVTQTDDELATETPDSPEDASVTTTASSGELSSKAIRLSFLWDAYEPQFWYWEVVETTRRLMLTAVLSVCGAGTSAQSIFAVLLALVYIKVYGFYVPYEADNDDVIAEVGQFQIFFSFLGALIYQNSLLGEEWNTAVSIVLIMVNTCVGVVFTYYASLDLASDLDEYKQEHWSSKKNTADLNQVDVELLAQVGTNTCGGIGDGYRESEAEEWVEPSMSVEHPAEMPVLCLAREEEDSGFLSTDLSQEN